MQITPFKISIDPEEVQWLVDNLNSDDQTKQALVKGLHDAVTKTLENLHNPKGFREDHYDN